MHRWRARTYLQPSQCTSGLGLIPEQECRAGDRSYAREMQQKVVESAMVSVGYCWVRVRCRGGRKDVCAWRVRLEGVEKHTWSVYVSSGTGLVSIAATSNTCTEHHHPSPYHHPRLAIASTREKQVWESLRQSISNHGSEWFPLLKKTWHYQVLFCFFIKCV